MKQGYAILAAQLVALLCALLLLSGCAVLFRGTTQLVPVDSVPAGAEVIVDGELVGQTPLEVELNRAGEHAITVRWNGQERSFTLRPQVDGEGGELLVADAAPGGVILGLSALMPYLLPSPWPLCLPHRRSETTTFGLSCQDLQLIGVGIGAALVAVPVTIDAATGGIMQLSPSQVFVAFE